MQNSISREVRERDALDFVRRLVRLLLRTPRHDAARVETEPGAGDVDGADLAAEGCGNDGGLVATVPQDAQPPLTLGCPAEARLNIGKLCKNFRVDVRFHLGETCHRNRLAGLAHAPLAPRVAFRFRTLGQSQHDHERVATDRAGVFTRAPDQDFAGSAEILAAPVIDASTPPLQNPLDRLPAGDDAPAVIQTGNNRVAVGFLTKWRGREVRGVR